eukprot:GILK01006399.1.p1 GENE.GILK01006399.1~~GILK01006399.1.p1  ORF type:complete len:451 (-),score=67.19 GILK01006399.1:169-1491(-)
MSTNASQAGVWQQVFDPASGCYYYYNPQTKESRWEAPESFIPVATYQAPYDYDNTTYNPEDDADAPPGTEVAPGTEKPVGVADKFLTSLGNDPSSFNIKARLGRPARKQVKEMPKSKFAYKEGDEQYNIWYDKYLGDREKREREPATTRCNIERDSGWTKADIQDPHGAYFCVHFARGACALGPECNYLHRLPTIEDNNRMNMLNDVFGRDRHATHRDDMGGAGNFNKESTTLYIGELRLGGLDEDKVYQSLHRHFSEWGEIDNIRVIPRKAIAFVRYKIRVSAEFAKVAMADQSLDHDEMINVRWAYDDPNPKAIEQLEKKNQQTFDDAVQRRVQNMGLTGSELDTVFMGYAPEELNNPGYYMQGYSTAPYPVTDEQYQASLTQNTGPMTKEDMERQKELERIQQSTSRMSEILKNIDAVQDANDEDLDVSHLAKRQRV